MQRRCKELLLASAPPTKEFVIKDSGKRQEFTTGARRDTQDGKGDYSRIPLEWLHDLTLALQRRGQDTDRLDLLPVEELLRLSAVYGKGAYKYGDYNWQKGIPMSRYASSINRHMKDFAAGDRSEDHMMQLAWNCFAMAWTETAVREGRLPRELGDYGTMIDPTHVIDRTTTLKDEDGSYFLTSPTVFALSHVCVLKETKESGTSPWSRAGVSLIVHRRRGAIIKGWVSSHHLTPLVLAAAGSPAPDPVSIPTS